MAAPVSIIMAGSRAIGTLSDISRKSDDARLSVSKLSDAFKGLTKLTGAGTLVKGLDLLTETLIDSVEAAAKLERSQLTIEALTERTGFAAGRTAGQIEALAQDIGRNTEASTTEVRGAATQLLAFRSVAREVFDDTLRLAQDLAAVGFDDVKTNTVLLAKALQEPVAGLESLKDFGIQFNAQQQDLIRSLVESGRRFEAQKILLAEVAQSVGGVGAKQAGGLTGAVDNLSDEWTGFLENVGNGQPIEIANAAVKKLGEGIESASQTFFPDLTTQIREIEVEMADMLEQFRRPPEGVPEFMNSVREGEDLSNLTSPLTGLEEKRRPLLQLRDAQREEDARALLKSLELQIRREETLRGGNAHSGARPDEGVRDDLPVLGSALIKVAATQQDFNEALREGSDLLQQVNTDAGALASSLDDQVNQSLQDSLPLFEELSSSARRAFEEGANAATDVEGQVGAVIGGSLQNMPGETTRLLQDVLTELMRFLQEIEGAALVGKSCEAGAPPPGSPQPGVSGSPDLTGGALCPTEELERQRDCLLLESGEAANGLQAGLLAYTETALDVNGQVKAATLSAFQGMEDALVSFVQTGKLDFKSLADSIIADLIRISIKAAILGSFAKFLGGLGDSAPVDSTGGTGIGSAGGPINDAATPKTSIANIANAARIPAARSRPDRMAQGGPVNLNFTVNNEVPEARVEARRVTDDQGGIGLEIQVARIIAKDVRQGGEVFRSFRDTFGVNQQRREVS